MEFFVRDNGEGISIQNGDWVSVGRILNGGQLNAIPFYSYTDFSPQTVGPELAVSEGRDLYILIADATSSYGTPQGDGQQASFSYKLDPHSDETFEYTRSDQDNGVGLLLPFEANIMFDYLAGGTAHFKVFAGDLSEFVGKVDTNEFMEIASKDESISYSDSLHYLGVTGFYSNSEGQISIISDDGEFDYVYTATEGSRRFSRIE